MERNNASIITPSSGSTRPHAATLARPQPHHCQAQAVTHIAVHWQASVAHTCRESKAVVSSGDCCGKA